MNEIKLEMEWDFKPQNPDNRKFGRLKKEELYKILQTTEDIKCSLKTSTTLLRAQLLDISASGCLVKISSLINLFKNSRVDMSFNINHRIFKASGFIRRTEQGKIGIEFLNIDENDRKYLVDLFCAYVLQYKIRG